MTAYLLRRLGTSIVVLIGISIFIYLLLHAIYPSPARAVLGLKANNAQINAWNKENGFSRPVIEKYLSYMNGLLHGNLGYSYADNQTVASLFAERLARSIYLSGMALLDAIRRAPASEYLLVEPSGQVYGVLAARDVEAAFAGV